jgi:putative membrane protein
MRCPPATGHKVVAGEAAAIWLGGAVSGDGEETREPREPDYRFTLANERTLLAWIRTSLALDAGGLAVIRFAPALGIAGARESIGTALVLVGAITAAASYRRFVRIDRAMRTGRPLPLTSLPLLLAVTLVVLSVLVFVLLVVAWLRP